MGIEIIAVLMICAESWCATLGDWTHSSRVSFHILLSCLSLNQILKINPVFSKVVLDALGNDLDE